MPIFTVSIAFELSEGSWQVRRAHTVVATHASCRNAIGCACEIAVALRQRMHCDIRLRVKDRHGYWHVYASVNDEDSAAAVAASVLSQFRFATSEAPVARAPDKPFVFFNRAKSFLERSMWRAMHRPVHAAVTLEG